MSWPQIVMAVILLLAAITSSWDEVRKPQHSSTAAAMIIAHWLFAIIVAFVLSAGGFW